MRSNAFRTTSEEKRYDEQMAMEDPEVTYNHIRRAAEVHRQVRVVGRVERVSRAESEEYFHSRPVGSQIGAWASRQSSVVGEGDLQARVEKIKERFGEEVPAPEFWGGWRVIPE